MCGLLDMVALPNKDLYSAKIGTPWKCLSVNIYNQYHNHEQCYWHTNLTTWPQDWQTPHHPKCFAELQLKPCWVCLGTNHGLWTKLANSHHSLLFTQWHCHFNSSLCDTITNITHVCVHTSQCMCMCILHACTRMSCLCVCTYKIHTWSLYEQLRQRENDPVGLHFTCALCGCQTHRIIQVKCHFVIRGQFSSSCGIPYTPPSRPYDLW